METKQKMETSNISIGTFTSFWQVNNWNSPEIVKVEEAEDAIEIIYKQYSNFYRTGGLPPYNDTRIFKIVYSCVDGKWNKSEPIYGVIIPAQEEYYEFE